MLASIVDWAALGKVILYSFVATLGLTTVFSFGIVGMARFDERRNAALAEAQKQATRRRFPQAASCGFVCAGLLLPKFALGH